MALRKFAPAAAKRLSVLLGRQGSIYSPAMGTYFRNQQLSLFQEEFGSESRNFRCSLYHLFAANSSRSSPPSSPADGSVVNSGSRRKTKGTSDIPRIKERPVVFECQECEALCVKRVQQEHFEKGVVIVRCLECRSVNLVADHLGLFKEKSSVQKFLSEHGVDVRYGAEGSYELLAEDLAKMAQMGEQKVQVEQQEKKQQQQQRQEAGTG